MTTSSNQLVLIGLNEINFSFIEKYIAAGYLPTFKFLFEKYGYIETTSENKYELLEPWIQWVSIHTGKSYAEHQVFRLGDIVDRPELTQLWEIAEQKGLTVGAVSPFNAANRLRNPSFFVPDPWTQTPASGSTTLKALSNAVSAMVNANAKNEFDKSSMLALLKGVLAYVPVGRYFDYLKLGLKLKNKATKANILDNLLADVFLHLWKKSKPQFSSLFLNSGAHEQHHYMFNSKVYEGHIKNPDWYIKEDDDPVLDILLSYDKILKRLLALNCRLFIATGLHQNPHEHLTYYWRLKNHSDFLALIGIDVAFKAIPRMSRDFLVEAGTATDAQLIDQALSGIHLNGKKFFEVDNRGLSLFIELIYDDNIVETDYLEVSGKKIKVVDFVAFVAIKNGEHNGVGYFIDTASKKSESQSIPVTEVFNIITRAF